MSRAKPELPSEALLKEMFERHPILRDTADSTIQSLIAGVRFVAYSAGSHIITESNPADTVYFLLHGIVRIHHAHLSDSFSPKILVAPCHFGHLELLVGRNVAAQSVKVVRTAWTAEIPWTYIRKLLAEDHSFTLAFLEDLALQFFHTADAIKQMAFGGLTGRIVNVLLSYADTERSDSSELVRASAILNHRKIAEHVASPRRSVIRVMRQLSDENLIGYDDGKILIYDVQELEKRLQGPRIGLAHRGHTPSLTASRERVSSQAV